MTSSVLSCGMSDSKIAIDSHSRKQLDFTLPTGLILQCLGGRLHEAWLALTSVEYLFVLLATFRSEYDYAISFPESSFPWPAVRRKTLGTRLTTTSTSFSYWARAIGPEIDIFPSARAQNEQGFEQPGPGCLISPGWYTVYIIPRNFPSDENVSQTSDKCNH